MKDPHDNKTKDWVLVPISHIAVFERVLRVLKVIQDTPVATTAEVHSKALSDLNVRSAQRYLNHLEKAGYVKRKGSGDFNQLRYFLTDKSKQIFGVACDR